MGASAYTRERLEGAARLCSSIDEVIAHSGSEPGARLDRCLRKRFAHDGIGISHSRDSGRQPCPGADDLRAAVAESVSNAGTPRLPRRPDTGTRRALLTGVDRRGRTRHHALRCGRTATRSPAPGAEVAINAVHIPGSMGGHAAVAEWYKQRF